jgi:hypothetical protein
MFYFSRFLERKGTVLELLAAGHGSGTGINELCQALGYKILVWRSLKGTTKVHYVV